MSKASAGGLSAVKDASNIHGQRSVLMRRRYGDGRLRRLFDLSARRRVRCDVRKPDRKTVCHMRNSCSLARRISFAGPPVTLAGDGARIRSGVLEPAPPAAPTPRVADAAGQLGPQSWAWLVALPSGGVTGGRP